MPSYNRFHLGRRFGAISQIRSSLEIFEKGAKPQIVIRSRPWFQNIRSNSAISSGNNEQSVGCTTPSESEVRCLTGKLDDVIHADP